MVNMKSKIESDLKACKAAFDKVNIPWVIMGGIVLGYARYKDIMEWDTDVDIAVVSELTASQRRVINSSLAANGFRLNQTVGDFVFGTRETSFNIFFFHKNGEHYESFPKTLPGLKFVEKALWYDKIQFLDFLCDKYPMPNHVENFVDAHYGSDWRTNIVKDHSVYFKNKRGLRDGSDWLRNRKRKEDGNLWWPALLKIEEDIGDFNEV